MTARSVGLHRAFEDLARRSPASVAVTDDSGTWTYRELDERADALAAHLVDRGVEPGQPVAVQVAHDKRLALALLAVLKAGGACLPLDLAHPAARLEWMLGDAAAAALVVAGRPDTDPGELPVVDLDDERVWGRGGSPPATEVSGESPAYIVYTSGSTGQPKGVVIPHRGLQNHQQAAVSVYGLVPGDAVLQLSSVGFDISIEEMFPTWAAGGRVVFRPEDAPLSGSPFLADLERLGITVLDLPTAFWHEWVRDLAALDGRPPGPLRALIVGGERADAGVFGRWRDLTGDTVRWFNTYGPTEASVVATTWEAPSGPAPQRAELPIGTALPGVTLHVLGDDGRPVPDGASGELFIGGAGVALGYLNRPELTAERFVGDTTSPGSGGRLYRTGDKVAFQDGLLMFMGRTDDQVKIRGFRVEPGEVEAALATQPGVDQAVVVGRPGRNGDQRLVGYLVPKRGAHLDPAEILRVLPERLPVHLVPSSLLTLEALPLTVNGKVDRAALPAEMKATRVVEGEPVPARDGLDRALVDLWKDVLDLDEVGITDDFFDLGGHSLAAVRFLALVEWLMGAKIPMSVLLGHPTIEHLGDWLRSGATESDAGLIQPVRPEGERPPLLYICTVETGVVALRHVLPYLSPAQPVYAFVLRRTRDRDDVASIEDLARLGLAGLEEITGGGPCSFLGYSFGGLVAYEMASRLRGAGRDVPMLGLLDTWSPLPPSLAARLRFEARAALTSTWNRSPRQAAGLAAHAVALAGREALSQTRSRGSAVVGGPSSPKRWAAGELLLDDGTLSAIYDRYRPSPYAGRVLLLTTEASERRCSDAWLGWRPQAAGTWSVVPVPGQHGNVMQPDNAPFVGKALADALSDPEIRAPRRFSRS